MTRDDFSRFDAYLGDGVYFSFDGYQVWLAANHHENKVVALEPAVWSNLVDHVHRLGETLAIEKEQSSDS
jgi:hypothetical protein